jgi:hypothetical protein
VKARTLRNFLTFLVFLLGAAALRGEGPSPAAASAPSPPPAHWAFLIPERPSPPAVRRGDLIRGDLDRFVEALLEEKGLCLAPEAGRAALIRRVSFDLTGLPPSPAEVAGYLADPAPGAYERMVEAYLASPRYGERWGRHWLDAAGYADSNGYFSADSDRPLAYRYRDYVVASLNADKPLDRFIQEQIAGDELAGYRPDMDVGRETAELLAATQFLRNSQDGTGESDGNDLEVLIDKLSVLDGTVQIVGSCLLGLTLQCARCHDHKFDPISQVEYYRLRAIFAGAYCPERWLKPNDRVVMAGTRAEREEYLKKKEKIEQEIKALQDSLAASAAPLRKQLIEERLSALDEPLRAALRKAQEKPKDQRSGEETALLKKHEGVFTVKDEDLAKRFEEYPKLEKSLQASIGERRKGLPASPALISVLTDVCADPPPHHLLKGGLASAPGQAVEPGVPAVLTVPGNAYRLEPAGPGRSGTGRRLAFARWLTSKENPVVSRVLVNRVWQHHFGTGLVSTSDNLGRSGAPPSHPALLDWLAIRLVEGGFRLKDLHRTILSSATYRTRPPPGAGGSAGTPAAAGESAAAEEPGNRPLSRSPWRLDAESLRDAMLCVSGELDLRMGGPYVPTRHGNDGQVVVDEKSEGAFRRSLYLQQKRTQPLTVLEVFDAPLIVGSCTRRSASTTPLQSLALLNSEFALARAAAFARRLEREAGVGREARISLAFLLAVGRGPGAEERQAAVRFLAEQLRVYPEAVAERQALADLCQTIFASNAFLYVD